ncbi:MAG: cob(I)yrinic acid a,c-diamide adenosyltransferase [Thermodesulfovibrionales bacterium]
MRKGYIQVYTGNGKGKTTAALGLALRAAGAGLKVYIIQFIKKRRCSEHKALERFSDLITIRQYGRGFILRGKPTGADVKAAQEGLKELKDIIKSGNYDIVILDEANVATHYGLISVDDLLGLMTVRHRGTELIITGRYADEKVIRAADLVTEMKEIKHYRRKGVKARTGIEK